MTGLRRLISDPHCPCNRLMVVLKGGQLSKWSSPTEIVFFHLLLVVSFFDFGQCCAQQRTKLGNFTKLEYYLGQLSKIRPIGYEMTQVEVVSLTLAISIQLAPP